ncbi:MAG: protease inhibitor I42 family protein [Oscillospiraceae bacterium]|nr:protease inhibitor I42 family protein [Oscillospiraceae bacterium]
MKKIIIVTLLAVMALAACGNETALQTVTFTLDSNPTTGFSWQVTQSEDLFEVKKDYVSDRTDEALSGVGGRETIVLTPTKAGKAEVTLTYARPWEGGEAGDQLVYSFEVDRNLQVTMTGAVGYGTDAPVNTPMPEIK